MEQFLPILLSLQPSAAAYLPSVSVGGLSIFYIIGTFQYMALYVWIFSLNVMFRGLIHVVVCISTGMTFLQHSWDINSRPPGRYHGVRTLTCIV